MKRTITLLGLCVLTALGYAQTKEEIEAARGKVGINAVPKATLEIKPTPKNAEKNSDTNEGILIPRLSKLRVANIKNPEESTLVYIDDVSEGSGATVDHAVNEEGYYFFKKDRWLRLHDTTTPGFNALLHGEEAPASALGNNGDFYITQKHKLLYGPKTDAGWGTPITLAGASGPTGPAGSGAGNSFPIPVKKYTCGPDNINQILRSVEGYFECKQHVRTTCNYIGNGEAGYRNENPSPIFYYWTYTGIFYVQRAYNDNEYGSMLANGQNLNTLDMPPLTLQKHGGIPTSCSIRPDNASYNLNYFYSPSLVRLDGNGAFTVAKSLITE